MAKQIKSSEIYEDDIFKNIRDSAEKTIQSLEKINAEFKKTGESLKKSIGGAKFDSSKSINEFVKAQSQANKLSKEAIALQKAKADAERSMNMAMQQSEKATQQSIRTEREKLKLDQDMARANERKAKANEKASKTARDEANAYKQLERNTRELKNQSKTLGAEMLVLERNGQKNSKAYRELASRYNEVTRSAQQGDAQLKKLDKQVGDNFRNVGNYSSALGGLKNVLGQLGIAFGVGTIIKSTFNVVKDFDQGIANLASVIGKSREEIKLLEDDAKRLGATTRFTATQVAEMQTEFAKLGFNEQEILNATESTLSLAGATGTDLARATEVAGGTLRGFGLDSKEMGRVNDVMAKSFSTSALGMENFAESMKYVAPVANSAGMSIEETTAMLGKLADNGIKGSQAGTALRRIISEMAKTGKPTSEALKEIADAGITLTDAQDEVGRSAQTALLVLAKNMDGVAKLTETYENAEGSAKAMADTQLNTIGGSLDLLTSAWEGYILQVNEASGAGAGFSKFIQFLANNLPAILNTIFKIATAFALYKSSLLAIQAIQFLFNGGLKQTIVGLGQMLTMTKKTTEGMEDVADGSKKAGKAMGAIPWVMLITLAIELATKIYDVASGLAEQRRQTDLLNKTQQMTQKQTELILSKEKEALDERLRLLDLEIRKRKAVAKTDKEREALETERLQRIEKEQKVSKDNIQGEIDRARQEKNILLQRKKDLADYIVMAQAGRYTEIELNERLKKVSDEVKRRAGTSISTTKSAELQMEALNKTIAIQGERITTLKDGQKEFNDAIQETDIQIIEDYGIKVENNTGKIKGNVSATKDFKTEIEGVNEALTKQNELLAKLDLIQQTNAIRQLQDEIDIATSNAVALAKETGEIFSGQQGEILPSGEVSFGEQLTEVEKLIEEKNKLERQSILDQQKEKIALIEQGYIEQSRVEREKLQEKFEDLLKQEGETLKKRQKIIADYEQKLAGADEEKRKKLIAERDYKLSQEQFTKAEMLKIEQSYMENLKQIEMNDLQRNADFELEKLIIADETNNELIQLEKQKNEEINDLNDKLIDAQEQYFEERIEITSTNLTTETDKEKEAMERRMEYFKLITEYFKKQSDERIKQYEKEISKAEEQYNVLQELAKNGNINAKESLAEQQRIINEANAKKEKEQRRQARLQLLETAFSTYNQKVASNSKNPLAETIRDIGLLRAFIDTLPAYYDGTEDTGKNGNGVDGKGGFHAILHPNERVIPKSLNDKIGDLSNEQLTKIAMEYQNGKTIRGNEQIASALDTMLLVKKIDELNSTIKNKPETNIELGEITQSAMNIVKSVKKGNTTIYNRYRIKP